MQATLKQLRKAAGLSGEAVAQRVGVTKTTYYMWEWGQVMPGGVNLTKLESVLPGSINALVSVITDQSQTPTTQKAQANA